MGDAHRLRGAGGRRPQPRQERGARLCAAAGRAPPPGGRGEARAGIAFTATTTLDVRERNGIPDEMEADHLRDPEGDGGERSLQWDVFEAVLHLVAAAPRHHDGVRGTGDFASTRAWRMQPLPGKRRGSRRAPHALVELSPRAGSSVALLEGRIASALGENLEAIRNYVKSRTPAASSTDAPRVFKS